jgi:hypothetical protein
VVKVLLMNLKKVIEMNNQHHNMHTRHEMGEENQPVEHNSQHTRGRNEKEHKSMDIRSIWVAIVRVCKG